MVLKFLTTIAVIIGNILMFPVILTRRWKCKEVFGFRVYLETNELTGDAMYAYIVRPYNLCGLMSDYIDWSKDFPRYDGEVSNVSLPIVLIDMESIKNGDILVFPSFEKFDEYRENKYKLVLSEKNND